MPLPKLDTPTYSLVLPSTGQTIKYRPFLVKEQKILMMAQESEEDSQMYQVMSDIVKSCTFDEIDTEVSPIFDIEYIFLKLRSKSVGEKTTVRLLCPDDKKTYGQVDVNLDDVEIQMTENHTNVIQLTDKIKLIMKYPLLRDMKNITRSTTGEQIFAVMKHCIWEVHDGDKIYNRVDITDKDIEEFIDSFNTEQLESIIEFFQTMPKIRHAVNLLNPKTNVTSEVVIEGIDNFLA
tara:strand:+ start:65 stop:769 length:705 start_codon:yes stop_codon:yes gene_type:complete